MSQETQDVQPVIHGHFVLETTDLEVTASLGDPPTNIVLFTDSFSVALTFQGQPLPITSLWWGLKNSKEPFEIRYFAESMDTNNDVSLGTVKGNLDLATDIYSAASNP